MYKKINKEEMLKLINEGAILIDVREPLEYQQKHILNALNFPISKLSELAFKYDKDKKIIFYCSSGIRSRSAANMLISLGFKNIYDLGSMSNF